MTQKGNNMVKLEVGVYDSHHALQVLKEKVDIDIYMHKTKDGEKCFLSIGSMYYEEITLEQYITLKNGGIEYHELKEVKHRCKKS